jgi:hypothetical protein
MKFDYRIDSFGNEYWYDGDNLRHVKTRNNTEFWYDDIGHYHCLNGPAVIWVDKENNENVFPRPFVSCFNSRKEWWIHGERIVCKNNDEFLRIVKLIAFS